MVCKILDSLSAFSHGILLPLERPFYLLEWMGLRNEGLQAFGLRIAFSICRRFDFDFVSERAHLIHGHRDHQAVSAPRSIALLRSHRPS